MYSAYVQLLSLLVYLCRKRPITMPKLRCQLLRHWNSALDVSCDCTGSEDGTVRVWHSTTYRLENNLNYGLERVWALAYLKGSNKYCPSAPQNVV